MNQANRLSHGGEIDRARPLQFRFNGTAYQGYEGDTLASALIANDVKLVARSFKYHRPRGIMAAGVEEPNAMVQLETGARTLANLKATEIALYDGLEATSVNAWPSVKRDIASLQGFMSRFFPAGFYYKTFFGSPFLWHNVWEPFFRRSAGWGKAPDAPDTDRYDRMHAHCDLLVVGGGPAGLQAAHAAGRAGARVIVADLDESFGGSLLGRGVHLDGQAGPDWVSRMVGELQAMEEVTLLPRTTVFGYFDQNYLAALERRTDHLGPDGYATGCTRQRLWRIRAGRVVLATGAHERPLVFANNDRPGVMLAGAVNTYIQRFGVCPGRDAVVYANNDRAYDAAISLAEAGAQVTLADPRLEAPAPWTEAARAAGVEVHTGHGVTDTKGGHRVRAVRIQPLDADGRAVSGPGRWQDCDLVAVSGGYSPVVHLFSQAKGKLVYDDETACFRPGEARQAQASVGACNGTFALDAGLGEGEQAGLDAAEAAGHQRAPAQRLPQSDERPAGPPAALWLTPDDKPFEKGKTKHFIDFQNDSTAGDIRLAAQEGFDAVEHMKRYTLTGFGTDQGKTSNINALAILAEHSGKTIPDVGTTTFRPPYTPVTLAALAGRDRGAHYDPARLTPMHDWHVANGALFEDVGQWKRPWYFPHAGETLREAVARECRAAREGVALLDASTLGKIDIQGPDAAEFLNRVYTNAWKKLPVGRIRYGLMCTEDGMVFDDGTTARIADNRYLMSTTTGGAARVMDHLEEYLQTEWPELRVRLTSVTEQWAVAGLAGPKSRDVLARLTPDTDLSADGFPFLTWKDAEVAGLPARIFRISFTGELQFEVNVAWRHGNTLWSALMEAGAPDGITPYGTETMHVLRAEKGFIIAGQETDGTVTPIDLGMDWAVSKKKDFMGARSLSRSDCVREDRRQLVGIRPKDPAVVLPEGAQLVMPGADTGKRPVAMEGFVSSSYWSAALQSGFGLGLVRAGQSRHGETLEAALETGAVAVELCDPVFYDKEGARRDG